MGQGQMTEDPGKPKSYQTMWGGNKQQINADINLQWENEERKAQELIFLHELVGEL